MKRQRILLVKKKHDDDEQEFVFTRIEGGRFINIFQVFADHSAYKYLKR